MENKNIKKRIIFSVSFVLFLVILSNLISAQMCDVKDMKTVLKKALFNFLPAPELSKLNVTEIKDLLNFYLNSSNLTTAKCDIKATLSNIPYDNIISEFLNLTVNTTIPYCEDGTHYGECSATKPKYCFAGQLVNRCKLCSCPSSYTCQINETAEFTIHEGRWGKCMLAGNITCKNNSDCPRGFVNYFCQNNDIYGNYPNYTCINPGTVNSYCLNSTISLQVDKCNITKNEYCFWGFDKCQLLCSDKTRFGQCSSTKPLYCSNGTLISNCTLCGCPSGQSCQKDENCIIILKMEETLTFTSAGKQTVYLSTPKNMTVMAARMDLISSSNFSSLDIGNNEDTEWNSFVYNVHEKEWVGSCSTNIYLKGGKLGIVWRGGFPNIVRIFPLGGRINSVTIDDVHILIKPTTDIIMDNLQLDFIDGELKDMGVTMDGSICKIGEKNVASTCSSNSTQLFTNYSLSDIQSGWIKIPLKNELSLNPGSWKIMFTMHYPNPSILPSNAGVGIKMCGYQETGNMLFTNLSGKKYYENGSVYIQLVNQEISDFKTTINNYLATCTPDADGNCLIPLVFHSDSAGIIKISNINVSYLIKEIINQTCSDGTLYSQCSSTKPLYCSNGTLINNCNICGCSPGQECVVNGSCTIPIKPILNMTFECDAKDSSGYGNDGTIYGATFTDGKIGNALSFDGVDNYVSVTDSNSLDITGNLTLEAWIYPKDISGSHTFIVKGGENWVYVNYLLRTSGDEIEFKWYNVGFETHKTTNVNLVINNWYHVVAVHDSVNNMAKIYVNGNEKLSESTTKTKLANIRPLSIGTDRDSNGNPFLLFNGSINEVRIYNYTLTPEQISAHYQSELNQIGKLTCIKNCSDGTSYSQCSSTKPLYCSNGTLINNCQVCGCLSGETCQTDGSCKISVKDITLNTLSDGSTEKDFLFTRAGNQNVFLKIPKNTSTKYAIFSISGLPTQTLYEYPSHVDSPLKDIYRFTTKYKIYSASSINWACGGWESTPTGTDVSFSGAISEAEYNNPKLIEKKYGQYDRWAFYVQNQSKFVWKMLLRYTSGIAEGQTVTFRCAEDGNHVSDDKYAYHYTDEFGNPTTVYGYRFISYISTTPSFITNPFLDVGSNETSEWSYSGEFSTTETTPDFSSALNTYLADCTTDADGNCLVPLVFYSDSAGIIKISSINVTYTISNPGNPDHNPDFFVIKEFFTIIWNFIKHLFI